MKTRTENASKTHRKRIVNASNKDRKRIRHASRNIENNRKCFINTSKSHQNEQLASEKKLDESRKTQLHRESRSEKHMFRLFVSKKRVLKRNGV